jgi:leucyl aminopeptidase
VRAVVEGLVLGGYAPPAGGVTPRTDSAPVDRVELIGDQRDPAVDRGRLHADATALARDLAETPANVKTPSWLADRVGEVAAEHGLGVRIWRGPELEAAGFGGLRAVGGGSASPPCLVRLDYRPDGARSGSRPVVLVGKGITFDSGGLSIKSRDAMVPMKTDMSGAAAVLAALGGAGRAGVRRTVVGLLPLAENAVSGSSYRPGDVVRVRGGRTVEVTNTDAEGRIVLADALSYADAELDPDLVVDLATLTGAASLGLGRRHAALYTDDDALAAAMERAGQDSGEPVWRMPLVEDYRGLLDSGIADLRQMSSDAHAGGGSIVAALFLREFAGRRRWAHLDIAGPARSDKDEYEVTRGATGFGARLLLRWLEGLRA